MSGLANRRRRIAELWRERRGQRGWRWGRTWTVSSSRSSFLNKIEVFFSLVSRNSAKRHAHINKIRQEDAHLLSKRMASSKSLRSRLASFPKLWWKCNPYFCYFHVSLAFQFVFHYIFHSRPTRLRQKRKCTTTVACFYQHIDPLVNLIPLNARQHKNFSSLSRFQFRCCARSAYSCLSARGWLCVRVSGVDAIYHVRSNCVCVCVCLCVF